MKLLVISCLVALLNAEHSPRHHRIPRAIIHGEDAVPHEFPWIVQVHIMRQWPTSRKSSFHFVIQDFCTGSLISPNIVLTAAHCVKSVCEPDSSIFDPVNVTIYAGYHNYSLNTSSTKVAVRASKVFAVPPLPWGYDNYYNFDLAIIVLPEPIERSETIDFIGLANQNSPMVNNINSCYAAGYGRTESGNPLVLQKLRYEVMNYTECLSVAMCDRKPLCGPRKRLALEMKNMICGVGAHHGRVFHGDSGGPFMCRDDKGKWILHGVTSKYLKLFSRAPPVDFFTKVEPVREWLVKAINFYKS